MLYNLDDNQVKLLTDLLNIEKSRNAIKGYSCIDISEALRKLSLPVKADDSRKIEVDFDRVYIAKGKTVLRTIEVKQSKSPLEMP